MGVRLGCREYVEWARFICRVCAGCERPGDRVCIECETFGCRVCAGRGRLGSCPNSKRFRIELSLVLRGWRKEQ